MKELPILFNGPMVRALLDGRKTQTRRLVKFDQSGRVALAGKCWHRDDPDAILANPLGIQGDRLWARETWATDVVWDKAAPRDIPHGMRIWAEGLEHLDRPFAIRGRGRPSIHMPRWASRITLEVTGVRIERLQDITKEDAKAEGLATVTKDGQLYKWGIPDRDGLPGTDDDGWPWTQWDADPRQAFRRLWDSIYGSDPAKCWDANPWVWATAFRRVEA